MQVAVIEYCRSVLGLEGANSAEFDKEAADPVIMYMPEINPDQVCDTIPSLYKHCQTLVRLIFHLLLYSIILLLNHGVLYLSIILFIA